MEELPREEIETFLDEQVFGRLGCHHGGVTYIVPLIYARDGDALYIHATEGQKTDFARRNPSVCFEVDEHDRATRSWRSVIIQGDYEELDVDGAALAKAAFTRRFGPRPAGSSAARADSQPAVTFRIRIRQITGRAVRPA